MGPKTRADPSTGSVPYSVLSKKDIIGKPVVVCVGDWLGLCVSVPVSVCERLGVCVGVRVGVPVCVAVSVDVRVRVCERVKEPVDV